MNLRNVCLGLIAGIALCVSATSPALAQEEGRLPIIAHGALKQEIKSTPILERPNRPLHFYGNTVRRQYYRGTGQVAAAPAAKRRQ